MVVQLLELHGQSTHWIFWAMNYFMDACVNWMAVCLGAVPSIIPLCKTKSTHLLMMYVDYEAIPCRPPRWGIGCDTIRLVGHQFGWFCIWRWPWWCFSPQIAFQNMSPPCQWLFLRRPLSWWMLVLTRVRPIHLVLDVGDEFWWNSPNSLWPCWFQCLLDWNKCSLVISSGIGVSPCMHFLPLYG